MNRRYVKSRGHHDVGLTRYIDIRHTKVPTVCGVVFFNHLRYVVGVHMTLGWLGWHDGRLFFVNWRLYYIPRLTEVNEVPIQVAISMLRPVVNTYCGGLIWLYQLGSRFDLIMIVVIVTTLLMMLVLIVEIYEFHYKNGIFLNEYEYEGDKVSNKYAYGDVYFDKIFEISTKSGVGCDTTMWTYHRG